MGSPSKSVGIRPGSSTLSMSEQPAAKNVASTLAMSNDAGVVALDRSKICRIVGSIRVWLEREPDSGKEPAELRPGFLGVSVAQVGITIEIRCVDTDLRVLAERAELSRLCSPDGCEVGAGERDGGTTRT